MQKCKLIRIFTLDHSPSETDVAGRGAAAEGTSRERGKCKPAGAALFLRFADSRKATSAVRPRLAQ